MNVEVKPKMVYERSRTDMLSNDKDSILLEDSKDTSTGHILQLKINKIHTNDRL